MQKNLLKTFVIGFCVLALQILSQSDLNASGPSVQPCQSWRYNSTAQGYVCSYYAFSTRYAEQWELDEANAEIRDLKKRVASLEERVAKLENPEPPAE